MLYKDPREKEEYYRREKEHCKEKEECGCKIKIEKSLVFIFCHDVEIEKMKECIKTAVDGKGEY